MLSVNNRQSKLLFLVFNSQCFFIEINWHRTLLQIIYVLPFLLQTYTINIQIQPNPLKMIN